MTKTLPKTSAVTPENKGGRPTKFKPEYADAIVAYFDIEAYRTEIAEETTEYFKDGEIRKESRKMRLTPNKLPTLLGFARKIGVDYLTVYRWAQKGELIAADVDGMEEKDPERAELDEAFVRFCNAYNVAKELQKEFLIAVGLAGAAPPASFIFTAKNVTDMRDKIERSDTVSHQVFFVPKEIAEKHGLELPEREREQKPLHLTGDDVKVIESVPEVVVETPETPA